MIRYSLSSIFTSEPEYLPNRILSPGHVERDLLALVGDLAGADGDHPGLLGLLLGRVRDNDPALLDLFLLEPLHQKPIMQRTNLHTLFLLRWTSPGPYRVTRSGATGSPGM